MNYTCKHCGGTENILHSGTDAFMYGFMDDLYNICYSCMGKIAKERSK
jgi:predicted nucleic acid-binding Zn ribbon protein